jgi:glycosyltransferase involved in cell wall biosynthesis
MNKEVRYISHGDLEDGGYRHEKYFAQSLAINKSIDFKELRKQRLYIGLANINLVLWAFFKARAKYNVVAARLGFSTWLRLLFNQSQSYVVVHDYDKNRYNSPWLKIYYPAFFKAVKTFKPKRLKIVVDSQYWVEYFNQNKGIMPDNLLLFPNLFKVDDILLQRSIEKDKMIHLGQLSIKNSEKVYEIATILSKEGYYCYFSTLDKMLVEKTSDYSIEYFDSYEFYLAQMARSLFTLGFSKYHEGWNRVVHESALLNTPVIAFRKGGMQYLVKESDNYLVDNIEEALAIIRNGVKYECPEGFLYKYDFSKTQSYFNGV